MPELRLYLRSCRVQGTRALAVQSPTDVWLCCSESFQFAPPSAGSGFRSGQEKQQAQAQAQFAIKQRTRLFPAIGRESSRERVSSTCRSGWSTYHLKKKKTIEM